LHASIIFKEKESEQQINASLQKLKNKEVQGFFFSSFFPHKTKKIAKERKPKWPSEQKQLKK
jgi:hypothetical protein